MQSVKATQYTLTLVALFALLPGCNKADVQSSPAGFKTEITILEPAYAMRHTTGDAPWYSNMQVLLDEKPGP